MKVEYSKRAVSDIRQITAYYDRSGDPAVGKRIAARIQEVVTQITGSPLETFGPVAPLYRFKSEEGAVKMANDAPTLALSRSRGREGRGDIGRIAEAVEHGVIGLKEGIVLPKPWRDRTLRRHELWFGAEIWLVGLEVTAPRHAHG